MTEPHNLTFSLGGVWKVSLPAGWERALLLPKGTGTGWVPAGMDWRELSGLEGNLACKSPRFDPRPCMVPGAAQWFSVKMRCYWDLQWEISWVTSVILKGTPRGSKAAVVVLG